jgi:hypothetical protein
MDLYHGTSESIADELISRPDVLSVEKGGGELGRGFYAGDHVALAAAWARVRYGRRFGVLAISIDGPAYSRLAIRILDWNQVVSTWNELKARGATRTFLFGWDLVQGPLATIPHATQHKFESAQAEDVLRRSIWRKL